MFQTIRMLDRAKSIIVARHAYYVQDMLSTQNILIMHDFRFTEQSVMSALLDTSFLLTNRVS